MSAGATAAEIRTDADEKPRKHSAHVAGLHVKMYRFGKYACRDDAGDQQASYESQPPHEVKSSGADCIAENAGHSGYPAKQPPHSSGGQSDQRTTDQRGHRGEIHYGHIRLRVISNMDVVATIILVRLLA
jgi:hypothetical protein